MELFLSVLSYVLLFTTILTIVGFGGMFSERSGVINLALEGSMVFGALVAALLMKYLPSNMPSFLACLIVVIGSIVGGFLSSILLSIPAIKFKANQTLVGTAINILSTAFSVVLLKAISASETGTSGFSRITYIPYYDKFNFSFPGFESVKFNWLILVVIILVPIIWVIIYKSRFGLRLVSCGENPAASDSLGINVNRFRFTGVSISGCLAGFGGLMMLLTCAEWDFANGATGLGFLALAVMIFGQWKPISIFLGAFIFGLFKALPSVYQSIGFLEKLNIPSYVYLMLPFIVCLIALIFTSKKNSAPKAEGVPYDPGKR